MNSISRTSGNQYNKIDRDSWMLIPKYEEVERTPLLIAVRLRLQKIVLSLRSSRWIFRRS